MRIEKTTAAGPHWRLGRVLTGLSGCHIKYMSPHAQTLCSIALSLNKMHASFPV